MNEPSGNALTRPFPARAVDELVVPGVGAVAMENSNFLMRRRKGAKNSIQFFAPLRLCVRNVFFIHCIAIFIAPLLGGCVDRFGEGGTGEMVVPHERFHNVDALALTPAQSSPATTAPTTNPSADHPAPQLMLSLQECRALALKDNLDLKVDLYTPSIAYTSVTEEEAAFEAILGGAANFTHNTQPPGQGFPPLVSETFQPDANLTIPLRTGGAIRFDTPVQRVYLEAALPGQHIAYIVTPSVSITQNLLRGFGFDVAAQGIRLAFYQYQQSQAATKLEVIRVLAETDHVYWQLYAARRLLDVRRKQYELAVNQLERSRHQAAAGVIAEVDIVRAESGVADQVEQIILAENSVRQQERDLKRILNKAGLEMDTPTVVIPATLPNDMPFELDRQRLQNGALAARMEMLEVELQIAQETANVRLARNQMLPLLAFNYTYGRNGSSLDYSTAFDQVWNHDYNAHIFGLQLQVPIGNEAARSQLRRALLSRLQQLATREQRAAQVRQDVLNAADNLDMDWQRILASRKRVELAARTLDVEVHQFESGLRTSTDVLDAQARLADAQSSEVSSVTDYQIAQVDLGVATGTTLGADRVTWRPVIYGRIQP